MLANEQVEGPYRKRPRYNQQQQESLEFMPRRRLVGQRPVDYFSSMIHLMKNRMYTRNPLAFHVPPHPYYCNSLLPVRETPFEPSTALCTQWAHTLFHPSTRAMSRRRVYYSAMHWAPNGRRLLCSTNCGEFLLYNAHGFGLEVKTIGHEDNKACKALAWGSVSDIILSGDDSGVLKVWLSNFVSVSEIETNQRAIREISWAPGEQKFVTAGQDGSGRIWDTDRAASGDKVEVESKIEGHGGDIHTIDWHPSRALLLTGSQDRDARLWDPRKGENAHIATLQSHTQPLTCVRWHPSGTTFLTASRDSTVLLWDMRAMKILCSFQAHAKDVSRVAWHPTHPDLFCSAGNDGIIAFWIVAPGDGHVRPDGVREVSRWTAAIHTSHEEFKGVPNGVNDLRWSPWGHVLASCSNEVKFWTRNKPGSTEEIRGVESVDIVLPQPTTAAPFSADWS